METKSIKGFFLIYNKELNDPYIQKNSNRLVLLCKLKSKAHYSNHIYQHRTYGIDLNPGQLITTYRKLADDLPFKVAHTTIESWLKEFEERGLITVESIESKNSNPPRKGTMITIINRYKKAVAGKCVCCNGVLHQSQ